MLHHTQGSYNQHKHRLPRITQDRTPGFAKPAKSPFNTDKKVYDLRVSARLDDYIHVSIGIWAIGTCP